VLPRGSVRSGGNERFEIRTTGKHRTDHSKYQAVPLSPQTPAARRKFHERGVRARKATTGTESATSGRGVSLPVCTEVLVSTADDRIANPDSVGR